MYLKDYLKELNYENMPNFIIKYLNCPSLLRLKNIGYFCGMDYASKDIYNFSDYITRYDHSLTTSLLTYKLTKDKIKTIVALFHDIATPCFSHVIDYMNGDYLEQESTEEYTEYILIKDYYLNKCLTKDKININDIINFKKYTIVDIDRPKLCTDRLDGIILTSMAWTKNITLDDTINILNNIYVSINENSEEEITINNYNTARKIVEINNSINSLCHSKEDNYMMNMLANITKYAIDNHYITYNTLYTHNEQELLNLLNNTSDKYLLNELYKFRTIKKEEIPNIKYPKTKIRALTPLVNGIRINN